MACPRLVTIAIIEKNHKVLLIRRANEPASGKWAFPGGAGAFKKFSDPEEAVCREVEYDLSVSFKPVEFLNIYYRNGSPPVLSVVYIGKIGGRIRINKDSVIEYKLFAKGELKKVDLAFDQKQMALDYASL